MLLKSLPPSQIVLTSRFEYNFINQATMLADSRAPVADLSSQLITEWLKIHMLGLFCQPKMGKAVRPTWPKYAKVYQTPGRG